MALIRTFTHVDAEGKIELPKNIRVALGLKGQDIVELKVVGPSQSKQVLVSKRENYR
jgi:bifunctional DNA-binding transcriptional regulator/antitoxin component of YhaV-PrlF toxin-antitoxin module